VRRIINWATQNGWTYEGVTGSSHHRIRHEGGQAVMLPNTPSDSRGLLNTLAEIRRVCGKLPSKPNAGHYRHISQREPRFSMDDAIADRERREEYQAKALERCQLLYVRHATLRGQLRALVGTRITEDAEEQARLWIRECLRIENACNRFGFPVPEPLNGGD
jgi:predicted RNA binding protein YcfA (HicA-like mRNA interferase family)